MNRQGKREKEEKNNLGSVGEKETDIKRKTYMLSILYICIYKVVQNIGVIFINRCNSFANFAHVQIPSDMERVLLILLVISFLATFHKEFSSKPKIQAFYYFEWNIIHSKWILLGIIYFQTLLV